MEIPENLKKLLNSQYGENVTEKILDGYKSKRKVTLRINTLKTTIQDVLNVFDEKNISYEKVAWSKEAIIINNVTEKDIEEFSIYKEGKIYLQSLSSMLPPIILNPRRRKRYIRYDCSTRRKNNTNCCINK